MAAWVGPAIIGGVSLAGGLLNYFGGKDIRQAQTELLQMQIEQARRTERMSRGEFTPMERRSIEEANAPLLEQFAGILSQRGLSRSPAGASLMVRERARPFRTMQSAALGAAPLATAGAFQSAAVLRGTGAQGYGERIGKIVQNVMLLRTLQGTRDTETDGFLEWLQNLLPGKESLQGDYIPMTPGGGELA